MLDAATLAMAANHIKSNQNVLHSKAHCCDGQSVFSHACFGPSYQLLFVFVHPIGSRSRDITFTFT